MPYDALHALKCINFIFLSFFALGTHINTKTNTNSCHKLANASL